jgi:hypothetical protein
MSVRYVWVPTPYLPWLPVYRGYNKALFIHDVTKVVTIIITAIVLLYLCFAIVPPEVTFASEVTFRFSMFNDRCWQKAGRNNEWMLSLPIYMKGFDFQYHYDHNHNCFFDNTQCDIGIFVKSNEVDKWSKPRNWEKYTIYSETGY